MIMLYRLIIYVPEGESEAVKDAVFAAGGGKYKNYSHCCWETAGTGQFKPLEGGNPHIGTRDRIEYVQEMKVEMIVSGDKIEAVVAALKKAHPYEVPAYSVVRLEDF